MDAAAAGAGEVFEAGVHAVMLNGTGPVSELSDAAPGLPLYGGTGLNVFNHLTAIHLCPPFAQVTLSPELGAPDLERLVSLVRRSGDGPALEVIAQGNLEVMITADCLRILDHSPGPDSCAVPDEHRFLGIRDARGRLFPVRTDAFCMTHIRNAAETCLVDHMPALCGMGIDSVAIDARERPAAYIREMTGIYRSAIDAAVKRDHGMKAGARRTQRAGERDLPRRDHRRAFHARSLRGLSGIIFLPDSPASIRSRRPDRITGIRSPVPCSAAIRSSRPNSCQRDPIHRKWR